jgi:hypothetical protein
MPRAVVAPERQGLVSVRDAPEQLLDGVRGEAAAPVPID